MLFKKHKKIIPPLMRSAEETPFRVYEILEKPTKPKYQSNRFVSPIFGKNVKDDIVIPVMSTQKKDMDKLDSFRTHPRMTKDERIKKYGTEYPEFDLVRGKNLQEVLDSQQQRQSRIVKASVVEDEPQQHVEASPLQEENNTVFNKQNRVDGQSNITAASDANKREQEQAHNPQTSPHPVEKPKPQHEGDQEPLGSVESQESVKESQAVEKGEQVNTKTEEKAPLVVEGFVKSNAKASKHYQCPPMSLVTKPQETPPDLTASIQKQIDILNKTFKEFQVGASVFKHTQGPTVTRYEIVLDKGVNVRKVTGISDNIKMALAATEIRIEAPIPGKSTVGIEVPNEVKETVHFADIINQSKFTHAAQPLTIGLGLDIDGKPVYASIKSMPHGLVAGATGSGKSVCINTILMSLLLKYRPDELKLMLIDPKMVELTNYNDIPHLITPVINDSKAATVALKWVVDEMDRRFNAFSEIRARDIDSFNDKAETDDDKMPYIVIIVDELSDLMMVSSQHVEDAIKRLTQKARACGIHLIIATQRPSTDVIKGTIKANIPTRIAFSVASHVDSQTIIDSSGADKLLGRGDMLFATNGQGKVRVQGAFISDSDIENITEYIRKQMKPDYLFDQDSLIKNVATSLERDEYFYDIARFVVQQQEASINKISKKFGVGFNRAQGVVESLEEIGVVSGNLGSKARDVLVKVDELEEIFKQIG